MNIEIKNNTCLQCAIRKIPKSPTITKTLKKDNMFKKITNISDVKPAVENKTEIRFNEQPNGITVGCYMFMDSKTFDSPEALECRGIAFDKDGKIVSRPLHKFFNIGEKEWLSPEKMLERNDIAAVYEKLDGSMIATSLVNGELQFRSKKSFTSDVVKLANNLLKEKENIKEFSKESALKGLTAIFELTHPEARIVVAQKEPKLTLLHVRDNTTGEYVMLDKTHPIHKLIEKYSIHTVPKFEGKSIKDVLESLETMEGQEGYVIQFENGDMAKVKCPWYIRLHKSITFLRERDIATLSLHEELDDVKASLIEAGIDLTQVNEVEAKLKGILSSIIEKVDSEYEKNKHLDRKHFALANNKHQYFGLIMSRYLGKEVEILQWYEKNKLKDEFSLRPLMNDAKAEAVEG